MVGRPSVTAVDFLIPKEKMEDRTELPAPAHSAIQQGKFHEVSGPDSNPL